jgi:hypothetical protein
LVVASASAAAALLENSKLIIAVLLAFRACRRRRLGLGFALFMLALLLCAFWVWVWVWRALSTCTYVCWVFFLAGLVHQTRPARPWVSGAPQTGSWASNGSEQRAALHLITFYNINFYIH